MRTLQSELARNGLGKSKTNKKTATKRRQPSKQKEKLSRRDVEDLMGIRRDTFKRVGGAIRRK
ncbi:hypothetical protein [Solibacillus sp. FSL H8-0538]|uniref:hypothetical protein n=1 Tax=Solibacillus sp. FSL H8-0538 TaxID=2921400 RepID=UPI0030F8DD3E